MIPCASELYIQAVLSIIIAAWKEIRMGSSQFFNAFREVFNQIEKTQLETISKVAKWGADAIAADRLIVLFGSGHSFIPTMDTYPRIGSYPGWLPIHELSTSYMPTVLGNQALRQALKTVAITSLAHSSESTSRHSTGKRLFEVCDEVIDTCVPQGDALVTIAGFQQKVASASTIAACIIMQSLVAGVAQDLDERGIRLPVFPSHNAGMTSEQRAAIDAMTDAWYVEH